MLLSLLVQSLIRLCLGGSFLVACSSIPAHGPVKRQDADLASFGDTVNVLGAMERTDQDFVDGLALDLFSPKNRTLVVTQNPNPLPPNLVIGSTGEPYKALLNYSYVIKMNETANDLIAKVELPYDPVALQAQGVDPSNTYVGTLSAQKDGWVVAEDQRNVHISENKTRIIKMTSLDGEYLLLGRVTEDTSNIFVQYGQGDTRTVNLTGGPGVQEAEFIDGLRFSVQADAPMRFNVDLVNGIEPSSVGAGVMPLNSFRWVVNSSAPTQKIRAQMLFPVNLAMVSAAITSSRVDQEDDATKPQTAVVSMAKRSLGSVPGTMFQAIEAQVDQVRATSSSLNGDLVAMPVETRLRVGGLDSLDGEYVLLVDSGQAVGMIAAQGDANNGPSSSGNGISPVQAVKSSRAARSVATLTRAKAVLLAVAAVYSSIGN